MAELKFRVSADWEEVQRLRNEISKLKQEIGRTDAVQNPAAFNTLNEKLQRTSKELDGVTTKIAQTSATMETDFKKRIFDASQSVNKFTEEIIKQKKIVAETKDDVRELSEQYRFLSKYERTTSPIGDKLRSAKNALSEQKYALFLLTQEQATARLSVKKLRDEYALFREEGGGTAQTMDLLNSKLKGIGATIFGGMGLKELASRIISVRAEFESMETSLKVLLGGSEERLGKIMGQIKEYALVSPLNTKDMVGAVQMMISFGIEAEKSIDYLKAIGDISMGDTGKFNSLALAFSQMSSAGKLMGQDLMQMVNAGFNPLEEISRKTGKSIGELKNEMSKGAISSKMVQDAFISATSAGGKFFGMADEGSKTLNGQISMLQESFDMMFNELGSKGEGAIMTAVQAGTYLVENYQTIGKVLLGLIETYGVYKTALVVDAALKGGLVAAESASIVVKKLHAAVTWAQTAAQTALNTVMLMNPYVAAGAALIALCGIIYTFIDTTTAATEAQKHLNEANDEVEKSTAKEMNKLDGLCEVLETTKKGSKEWKAAKDAIISQYGQYDSKLAAEIERTGTLTSSYNNLTDAIRRSIAARQLKQFYDTTVKDSEDRKQENRKIIYDKISSEYGRQTTKVLMQNVAEYERTKDESVLQRVLQYKKKGGKWQSKTVRQMLLDTGVYDASQIFKAIGNNVREDKAVREATQDYLDMNNLTWEDYNETVYGIKKTSKTPPKSDNSNNNWKQEVKKARSEWQKEHKEVERLKKSGKATVKDIEQAQQKEQAASEKYKKLTGTTPEKENKAASTAQRNAEREAKKRAAEAKKLHKEQQRVAEQEAKNREAMFELNTSKHEKLENERIKLAEAQEEERIAAITDAGEKERAAYQLQYDKTIRQIQKQAEDLRKAKYEENKKEWELNNTDKTKVYSDTEEGGKGYKGVSLNQDEESYLQALINKADKEYENQRKKWQQEEINTLNEYLKEYGSFEEKKLAITKEYEEKIRNAHSVGERATLEMQRDKEIEKAKEDNLNANIDWSGVFSNLQGHTKKYLQGLKDQLQDLLGSGNLPIDQMSVISDKINAIDDELGKQQGIWDYVGEKAREHNRLLKEAADAQERLNIAKANEATAQLGVNAIKSDIQKQLSAAGIDMGIDEISTSSLNGKIDLTDDKFKGMAGTLQKLAVAEGRLADARIKTIDATNKARQAEDKAEINPAQKIADWFSDAQKFIEDKGIDQLPDLLDSIGLGKVGGKVSKGLDAFNSATGAAADFASGNYIGAALKSISAIKSFGSMLGIGGGNEEKVARTTERLTKSNEFLKTSIDSLKNSIDKSNGIKAIDSYQKAVDNQKQVIENTMSILKAQMGYHSAHHSNAYYWNLSKSDYDAINATLAKFAKDNPNVETKRESVNSLKDIYELTPEQMKAIADEQVKIWQKMLEQGKYDKSEYWQKYIELAGKLEELTEKVSENLTQITFKSLHDDFVSKIMDMKVTAADFADNFTEMMSKAWTNAAVADLMDADLKNFYAKWSKKMQKKDENGNRVNFSKDDIDEMRKEYQELADQALKLRDTMSQITGYTGDSSQKATANGVSSITYEQANNIVALTTAGNVSRDQIKDVTTVKLSSIDTSMRALHLINVEQRSIADETRTILANSYLELQGIHDDTSAMNKTLKSMSSDMSDIKRKLKDM